MAGKPDRKSLIEQLGGAAAIQDMSHEARADALEHALNEQTNARSTVRHPDAHGGQHPGGGSGPGPDFATRYPTVAEVNAQIPMRTYRRGVGKMFVDLEHGGMVEPLPAMPAQPTLFDFFELRFQRTRNHCFQSAQHAMHRGADEQVVLACLLHDLVQEIIRTDHGYWGAQLFEPYVPERTAFAIRYHQALRFFPDEEAGYGYPELYYEIYGHDYVPVPHIQADYRMVRQHRWYDAPRAVTISDLYSFDPDAAMSIDPFLDIVGRHFRQPREGLGNDSSAVAHMWRTIANPDAPL